MSCVVSPRFRLLNSVVLLGLFGSIAAAAWADEEMEFNLNFFGAEERSVANLHRFNHANYVPAGAYNVDVFVNGTLKGRMDVNYIENDQDSTSLCITPALVEMFDLKAEAFGRKKGGKCEFPHTYIPDAKITLDQGVLALNVDIPQALTVVRPRGYIPPNLWESGVPAAYVNYSASHHRYRQGNYRNESQSLYLNGGVNIGGWSLRHNGGYSRVDGSIGNYQRGLTYLQKGISFLNSELTLGDLTTEGAVSDSVSLRGIRLATDLRMLPQTQRGYAPRISDVANSNAVVSIFQKGNLIHQIAVPAGPFEINDLYPTGYSGELEVEIREADGNVRKFTVPYATLVPLMRPGQMKYQLAGGRYRYGNKVEKENVITGAMQYGLSNNFSLNVGAITHKHYRSGTAGFAFNTPFGAIAADITQARADLGEKLIMKGNSFRAAYNLYFTQTKTNIALATYRYFTRGYYSLDETAAFHRLASENDRAFMDNWRENSIRPKHRYQITVAQDLGEKRGALYFSGAASNYWNRKGTNVEYHFSYGNRYKAVSYNLTFSQRREIGSPKANKQLSLHFSLPLPASVKPGDKQGHYTATTTFNNEGRHAFRHSYSNTLGAFHDISYGLNNAVIHQESVSAGGSLHYRSGFGNVDASVSMDNRQSRQYSLGASGAVVLHPKGITLSDNVGQTFGVVHVKNGKGARLNNGLGKKLDVFGNAVIEHLTPYDANRIGIDPTDADINLEFDATEREVVPVAGATMLVNLNAKRNTMVLFHLQDDGQNVAMGAEAFDSKQNLVGFVAQGGVLFANNLTQKADKITVKWGYNEQCHFHYQLQSLDTPAAEGMINQDVQCRK